jgi:hypothetical protein
MLRRIKASFAPNQDYATVHLFHSQMRLVKLLLLTVPPKTPKTLKTLKQTTTRHASASHSSKLQQKPRYKPYHASTLQPYAYTAKPQPKQA